MNGEIIQQIIEELKGLELKSIKIVFSIEEINKYIYDLNISFIQGCLR